MDSVREGLPNKRPSLVVSISHEWAPDREPQEIDLGVGFYADGRVAECFADGHKEGSHMHGLLDDIAVVISLALQHGLTPEDMAKSIGRVRDDKPASIIGAILDTLIKESRA